MCRDPTALPNPEELLWIRNYTANKEHYFFQPKNFVKQINQCAMSLGKEAIGGQSVRYMSAEITIQSAAANLSGEIYYSHCKEQAVKKCKTIKN